MKSNGIADKWAVEAYIHHKRNDFRNKMNLTSNTKQLYIIPLSYTGAVYFTPVIPLYITFMLFMF